MVRVIAVDLDDTLLTPEKLISEQNATAIEYAREQGVRVVIVTARGWPNSERYYRQLKLDTPIIISSGARMLDETGQEIWARTMPIELGEEVLAFGNEHQIPLRIYIGPKIWNNLDYDPMGNLGQKQAMQMAPGQMLEAAPYQIFTKGEREVELLVKRFGRAGAEFQASVMTYSDGIPELCFLHPQSTKGEALAALCAAWKIPREEVMAIGDSLNDLSMVEWAGIGVAMPWGAKQLKERADWITSEGNQAGVAEAIYRAIKQKQTPARQGLA